METEMLSDEELAAPSGYKARGYQRRWLEERGGVFVETLPLVGRHYVRLKLGGSLGVMPPASSPPVVPTWTPLISKVR
ncbi:DUF4224 domain-containing protein [Pseudomonas mosselii]|uniref:DUF4224 domain-containing protein n=2 Tax=Pseudomonas mosselii TaxID=78327 RepID=UPI001BD1D2BA|nr:DUF4224 domain-containing protein [Pseudomonas mosselii]MBS9761831.1 DUF4224 domain-containing protein [Pseudomonas mosselii]MDH1530614.1 DUF4224 domain-containing protein [Pseudomonas mosselii]